MACSICVAFELVSEFLYAHVHRFTIVAAQFFHASTSFQRNVSGEKFVIVNPGYVRAMLLVFDCSSKSNLLTLSVSMICGYLVG